MIGGTGGSGTRAFARIARLSGMFIGLHRNESEDALEFGEYSDCWINAYLSHRVAGLPDGLGAVMRNDLVAVLSRHLSGYEHGPWGWKEPRSIYLLSFYVDSLPGLRFLHVVRDGRDMAISENQNQLRKHGGAYLGRPTNVESPVDSIALWAKLNRATARFGSARLGERYLRLRFEDLCRDPVGVATQMLEFFELAGVPAEAAESVVAAETIGRWRRLDVELLAALEQEAGSALVEFGYPLSMRPSL